MLETPNRDRRAEHRAATRAEILTAAWDVCRETGLAGLTLRDVAARVGMRAPSLYSYFESKFAIYDAMFAQGGQQYLDRWAALEFTDQPLVDLKIIARFFMEFCTEDPVRYQLLYQRTVPGFEPSPEAYMLAVAGLDALRERLARLGITDPRALDLLTALGTGMTNQQISNDPGGERWSRLADEAMEMFFAHITRRATTEPP